MSGLPPTPFLALHKPALHRNLERLSAVLAEYPKATARVHFKAHKTTALAKLQLSYPQVVGVCCQKPCEAFACANAGLRDICVTNQVVDHARLRRLAQLQKEKRVDRLILTVDNPMNVGDVADAARTAGVRLQVQVEVECGQGRCGVQKDEAGNLLRSIAAVKEHLELVGVQAYAGHAQHARKVEERRAAAEVAHSAAVAVKTAFFSDPELQRAFPHLTAETFSITGGGSGSFPFELAAGYTEVQPGSYVGWDRDYDDNEGNVGFEHALWLVTQVMSTGPGRVVVDVGLKGTSGESGVPRVLHPRNLTVKGLSDEHTILTGDELPTLKSTVVLAPAHIDPTFNLHDEVVLVDGSVEDFRLLEKWTVDGRGPGH